MIWKEWDQVKAEDRIKLHDEIADLWKPLAGRDTTKPTPVPIHLMPLLRELAFGNAHICECCEEARPDVMIYEACGAEDEHVESDMIREYEYGVCAWCIFDKRSEERCGKCNRDTWQLHTWVWVKDERKKMETVCLHPSYKHEMVLKHPYPEEVSE